MCLWRGRQSANKKVHMTKPTLCSFKYNYPL